MEIHVTWKQYLHSDPLSGEPPVISEFSSRRARDAMRSFGVFLLIAWASCWIMSRIAGDFRWISGEITEMQAIFGLNKIEQSV